MALRDNWYRELHRIYESDGAPIRGQSLMESKERAEKFDRDFRKHLMEVGTSNISIRKLAENTLGSGLAEGRELVEMMNPMQGGALSLVESGGLPNSGAFSKITGQIVYTAFMEELGTQQLIGDMLCTTVNTPFKSEKIPGIGGVGDKAEEIGEAELYPEFQPSAEYVETPDTVKRGMIVSLTDEMVFFDRTNDLLDKARSTGMYIAINKEKRILDAVTGISNTFKYNGTSYNTYTDSGLYDNIAGSNALSDWTDIQAARLLWSDILDPMTQEPINVAPDTLLVPEALEDTAHYIVDATGIRVGDITTGTGLQTLTGNPLSRRPRLNVVTNAYVSDRTSSTTSWFIGKPKKAFVYMQNRPLEVFQEVANSGAHFDRDVVYRWKFREWGVIAVKCPWFMVKCTSG